MIKLLLRGLLALGALTYALGLSPESARASVPCYGDYASCQCYVRAIGWAFEDTFDVIGYFPTMSSGSIIADRRNEATYSECETAYQNILFAFGNDWVATSACAYNPGSDHAAEIRWWYWESSYQDEAGFPATWYNGVGAPYSCCGDLGVCGS